MNDEIEVGEYIRTIDGGISQVTKIDFDETSWYWYSFNNVEYCLDKSYISKHSKNLIDLIEIGDFVNGKKVIEINCIIFSIPTKHKAIRTENKYYSEKQITTILTHEQYEKYCYKFEEE